ncbi:MAG: alpha/beta hydrolase family protein, partial [Micromonosporaceae bacterium]
MSACPQSRRLIALATGSLVLLGSLAGWSGAARAAGMAFDPGSCVTTASPVVPGIQVADPACEFNGAAYIAPFGPITDGSGQLSQVWTGVASDGGAYRVEVPPHWNGTLVMFAHGFRGTGTEVWVDEPQLRQYFIDNGFAWAASSYAINGYDPGDGVVDTHDLLQAFPSITGLHARRVIMSGLSMGGEITTAEIEAYKGDFAGAMPYCGVLAGSNLFDYYLGANVTAAGLTGTAISYPTTLAAGQAYAPAYQAAVESELPALGITPNPATGGQTFTTSLTKTGTLWAGTVEQLSGGERPGFAGALNYWNSFGFAPLTHVPFLFGLYPGTSGGTLGFANGSVAGNQHTFYTFSDNPLRDLPREIALNHAVLRVPVTATSSADALSPAELPVIHGDPGIPVLSVHGIGDLFVPFSMDQQYDAMMVLHGQGRLFVGRAIREVTHCGYTTNELSSAFSALVSWINTGKRPAGDNILNPRAVSSPLFGCRFTDPAPGAHPEFQSPV